MNNWWSSAQLALARARNPTIAAERSIFDVTDIVYGSRDFRDLKFLCGFTLVMKLRRVDIPASPGVYTRFRRAWSVDHSKKWPWEPSPPVPAGIWCGTHCAPALPGFPRSSTPRRFYDKLLSMRPLWIVVAVLSSWPAGAQPREDPRAISIHPFTGQRGTTFIVTVRGSGLAAASAASIGAAPFTVAVEGIDAEPPGGSCGRSRGRMDLVKLRVQVPQDAKPGRYPIRLITRNGISNALPLEIVDLPVLPEPAGVHEAQDSAVAISKVPAVYAG